MESVSNKKKLHRPMKNLFRKWIQVDKFTSSNTRMEATMKVKSSMAFAKDRGNSNTMMVDSMRAVGKME